MFARWRIRLGVSPLQQHAAAWGAGVILSQGRRALASRSAAKQTRRPFYPDAPELAPLPVAIGESATWPTTGEESEPTSAPFPCGQPGDKSALCDLFRCNVRTSAVSASRV